MSQLIMMNYQMCESPPPVMGGGLLFQNSLQSRITEKPILVPPFCEVDLPLPDLGTLLLVQCQRHHLKVVDLVV